MLGSYSACATIVCEQQQQQQQQQKQTKKSQVRFGCVRLDCIQNAQRCTDLLEHDIQNESDCTALDVMSQISLRSDHSGSTDDLCLIV